MDETKLRALAHPDRQRALADLGRQAAQGDTAARATLDALAASPDPWCRWLGLLGRATAGDDAALLAALTDPARSVRNRAWAQLIAQGRVESIVTALRTQGHSRAAARLAAKVMAARPSAELEAVILRFANREHPAWLDRLPACSEATVRAHLDRLDAHGGPAAWRRLTRNHPRVARDVLVGALQGLKTADSRLVWRIQDVLGILVEADPDLALDVVEALFALSAPPHPLATWLKRLARLRPARTFDRLRARQEAGLPAPRPGLFAMVEFPDPVPLGVERICWLLRHAPGTLPNGTEGRLWVARLSDSERAQVTTFWAEHRVGSWGAFLFAYVPPGPARDRAFSGWVRAACNSEGIIGVTTLDDLPRDLREQEARRHLREVQWLQARPVERRAYARLLGWDEAEGELTPWLTHPEGTERGAALTLWIATVRHDADAMPKAIAAVRRRKNEQDPVRMAMLRGLADLPPGRLLATPTEELAAIVGEALDAADLSAATAREAQRIAAVLVGAAPETGISLLTRVLQVRGSLDGHLIGRRLTPADAARLDPVLAPLVTSWVQRERAAPALGLLAGLGDRLKHMPATLDAVDGLCGIPSLAVLATLLDLLARHDRVRFRDRALDIYAYDPSAACLPRIAGFLATQRTDLLDPLLDAAPMTGRWATGRTHWVLDFGLAFGGWTSTQQARYATSLLRILDDPERDVPTCRWAIQRLAALTWGPTEPLRRLSSDPRVPIRDIAIRALPTLDDGSGLAAMLDCMGDDRARIATYALRRTLLEMPPKEVLSQLEAVPMGRVTVAKEVLRLMGELGGADARDALVRIGQGKLHRDVRIALLRALWDHIEHPAAWALLEAAASDPDPVLAGRLLSIPLDRLSRDADARLAALFAQVLNRPESEARIGFLNVVGTAPLRDHARVLFSAVLRHLATPDPTEAAIALGAILQRMGEAEVPLVVARIAGLLPQRPHALALVDRLALTLNPWSQPAHVALGSAMVAPLTADRLAATLAIRLAAKLRGPSELARLIETLETRGHMHHDAVTAAMEAVARTSSPQSVAELLVRSPAPRVRRIGLAALVASAAPQNGWTDERRALLRRFAADEAVEVAAPAAWIFPPKAEDERVR